MGRGRPATGTKRTISAKSIGRREIKESERLKNEACRDCMRLAEKYLSEEQLEQFEHDFKAVGSRYLFKGKKK